jgi:hypothetical protein
MVISAERQYSSVYARKPNVQIFDRESGFILIKCRGMSLEADNGLGGEKITDVDNEGYEFNIGTSVNERKATATIAFGGNNFDISALQQGKVIQSVTAKVRMPWKQQVTRDEYSGVTSGKQGTGMAANVNTRGSTIDEEGNTLLLTQQDFNTFNPNTPNTFAIGADFARKFSNDLQAAKRFVMLQPEHTVTARTFSEIDLGYLSIVAIYFNDTGTLDYFQADFAKVDVLGSGYKPGEKNPSIKFDLPPLGGCQPYKVYSTNELTFCDN